MLSNSVIESNKSINFMSLTKRKYILYLNSKTRTFWDLFIMTLAIVNSVTVPLEIAFDLEVS
jgi:hypothetical protein